MLNAFRTHAAKFAFAASGAFAVAQLQTKPIYSRVAHYDDATTEKMPRVAEVELKNGSKAPLPIVDASMMSFSALMKKNPIALYELVQKCKDNQHKLWVGTEPVLKDLGLLDGNGGTHRSVCDVLLSAVTCDGLDMAIGSPYQKLKAKI